MRTEIGSLLVALLPRLRRLSYGLAGSRDTGDELVQTACERALARADSWQPGTNFEAWMFTILRNAWYDRLRRKRTEGIVEDIDDHHDSFASPPTADPEARLTLDAVMKAVQALPPEQREVLLLVCVEDMSYKQVAEMLGIPVGTVMSRLARARVKISGLGGIIGEPTR